VIACLVLAGGAGTRLGGVDKAFLRLGGRALVEIVLARLGAPVAISANGDAGRFAAYGVPVLADGALAGKGPLAGVAAGLDWAAGIGADSLLSVPVDTPFVPNDLAARLGTAPSVAVWRGRQHHLVAHWPVDGRAALRGFLAAPGAYKVRDALALLAARPVEFGGDEDPFLNINTADDLADAARRERTGVDGPFKPGHDEVAERPQ
jgi:molybdopterin-guanine dinucleotide biosynthesis protein A